MLKNIRGQISKLITYIKRWFCHKKPSSRSDYDDIPITLALKSSTNLQKKFGLDETNYQRVAGFSHHDARAFYLYGILDEVIKATTSFMRWREFLSGEDSPPEDIEDMHIRRVVIEAVIDEQMMWQRKLVEGLCNLICFKNTNEQELYRALLLATNLDAYLGKQNDFKEFHCCENENINNSIKSYSGWLKQIVSKFPPDKLWFLSSDAQNKDYKYKAPGRSLSSLRQRYKMALASASEPEKIVLGISYEDGYSVSSKAIHLSVGAPTIQTELENVRVNMSHVGLLLPHLIIKCHELSGIKEEGLIERYKNCLPESNAADLMKSRHQRNHEVGDLVLAYGDFAEILDCRISKYGYHSYKVKYLSRPPIESITEEWFPAQYVSRIARKRMAKDFFKRNLLNTDSGKKVLQMIENMPEEKIYDCMRGFFKEFADAGILVEMLQEGARQAKANTVAQ